ncbi:DUF2786 domain-containing protein [Actinoallomurus rhizosphaericola]|uniref:DUF2786 domain-containing protein n=1 Tax=Actinoallomurus rhizosphaericola TaxID=2952536 RepID=UPI002093598D|nr:DUF2786 domain-containing protein [Actinoallomurus rhizosphaericola]MCO5998659.1 DUF2786 domain-containing protein [Actinoallomurus rhizosphaericola]
MSRPPREAPGADRALPDAVTGGVTAAWRLGWQPADLVRHAARTHGKRAGRMMTDAIAAEMRAYAAATVDERWRDQLTALGAVAWWRRDDTYLTEWAARNGADHATAADCASRLAALLRAPPRLEILCPPPGHARPSSGDPRSSTGHARFSSGDPRPSPGDPRPSPGGARADRRVLGKVQALLAKAESTEFPEEAEALTARAQELMARHSLDHALLAARTGRTGDGPVGRRVPIDDPYASAKALLLGAVADANRCRAAWTRALGFCTVLGFPADLDAVELLFASLLVQATSALAHETGDRARTRAFRRAFLASYGVRIGERLAEAAGAAEHRAAAETPGTDLLPVLAARERAVEDALTAMFPQITGRRMSVSDRAGWLSGQAAADRADLTARRPVR